MGLFFPYPKKADHLPAVSWAGLQSGFVPDEEAWGHPRFAALHPSITRGVSSGTRAKWGVEER